MQHTLLRAAFVRITLTHELHVILRDLQCSNLHMSRLRRIGYSVHEGIVHNIT